MMHSPCKGWIVLFNRWTIIQHTSMHCMDRDLSNGYTVIHSINIWGLEQGKMQLTMVWMIFHLINWWEFPWLIKEDEWRTQCKNSWINLNRQSKTALNILHGCVIPLTQFHDWYHWPVCLNMEVIYSNRIPNALWRNHLPKLKRHKQQMKKKCKIGHLGENNLSSL